MRAALAPLATALILFALPATAQDPVENEHKLQGIFHLSKRDCPDGGKRNCYYYVELRDQAAKALYDNMRTPAKKDLCTEGTMKTDKTGLHCFRSKRNKYGCYFGFDLIDQKLVPGSFSC